MEFSLFLYSVLQLFDLCSRPAVEMRQIIFSGSCRVALDGRSNCHSDSGALPVDLSPHGLAASSRVNAAALRSKAAATAIMKKKSDTCGQWRRQNLHIHLLTSLFGRCRNTLSERKRSFGTASLSVLSRSKRYCQESWIKNRVWTVLSTSEALFVMFRSMSLFIASHFTGPPVILQVRQLPMQSYTIFTEDKLQKVRDIWR